MLGAFGTTDTRRSLPAAQEAKMCLPSVMHAAQGMSLGQAVAWLLFHLGPNAVPVPRGPGSRALNLRTFLLNNKLICLMCVRMCTCVCLNKLLPAHTKTSKRNNRYMVKNCPFCPLPYLPFSSWKSVLGIFSEILFACTGKCY